MAKQVPLVINTTTPIQQLPTGDTLDAVALVRVAKAGTTIGSRTRINFIDGSGATVTVADDSGNDEVDVTVSAGPVTLNAQTGTTYTLVLTDASKLLTLSNASAITMTVPPNSSVAFPIGTRIDLLQIGAGQVTVAQGAGVTVNATPGLKFRVQHAGGTLLKIATDTWGLVGDLSA